MIPASGAGGRGFDSPLAPLLHAWGISSIGRVRRSQRRGTGIETRILHVCFYSIVVSTPACGAGDPGSNPGRGTFGR